MINNNVIRKKLIKKIIIYPNSPYFLFSLTYHLDPNTAVHRLATSKCDDPKNNHAHPLVNSNHLEWQMQVFLGAFI